ncbi:hypothetical protein RhiirC2_786017 [Rhizophagus irregularis]|uniref:Uncharacterized protein n=1 Tax=Rhizophagus irregularis TaxID=588596 RepID=A0A2N1MV66_9GLOM|nr:hypothetical protein RhiirC2_786017 [Rhizophagus irregularis]
MFELGNNTTLDTNFFLYSSLIFKVASFDYQKLKKPLQKFYRVFANDCSQSPGVLFWEISSGQPTFYAKCEHYDVGLIYDILQGLRETVVPGT